MRLNFGRNRCKVKSKISYHRRKRHFVFKSANYPYFHIYYEYAKRQPTFDGQLPFCLGGDKTRKCGEVILYELLLATDTWHFICCRMITQLVVVTNNIAHQNNMSICLKLFDKQKLKKKSLYITRILRFIVTILFYSLQKSTWKDMAFSGAFFICHEWVLPDSDSGSLSDHLSDKLQRIRTARIQS